MTTRAKARTRRRIVGFIGPISRDSVFANSIPFELATTKSHSSCAQGAQRRPPEKSGPLFLNRRGYGMLDAILRSFITRDLRAIQHQPLFKWIAHFWSKGALSTPRSARGSSLTRARAPRARPGARPPAQGAIDAPCTCGGKVERRRREPVGATYLRSYGAIHGGRRTVYSGPQRAFYRGIP